MSTPVSEPLHATGHAAGTTATGATPTGTAGTTTSAGHTSATPGASSTGPKKGFVQALEPLFKTPQFIWFVGHLLVLVGCFFYVLATLPFFRVGKFSIFWYREIFLSVIATFGIIIFETYKGKPLNPQALARDDNVTYLLVAFLWLVSKPTYGTFLPFAIFSLFHVLTYVRGFILPALGYPGNAGLSLQIDNFVKTYNDKFMFTAANLEFMMFLGLIIKAITFQRGSWIKLIIFFVFLRLRYAQSLFTRSVVGSWEVRVDGLLSHPAVPPQVKQTWVTVKHQLRKTLGGAGAPVTQEQRAQ
ncbi:hypothetical protein B0I75DRAFT_141083 [Yarrowia lipolytica]|uniref:YALI0D23617p n=2 Tax=Yarrowia lipolytica TaxID=4952 RepID=Q6C815_YARLI|nr:YALI0D23617p [Yarrowia lipolytica CLIB122]AOW04533.1 hypothetical protein YALI1_D30540g [Yarrowia lipolytica]KAB8285672.1 hypothetical protein BKA91DRAFT_132679 [Yarrowia lipolytica]KAE8172547.1 hypothetical protein BKA90DRAFT_137114 [Yarrowia lipolytica]KAJ8054016.1 hypothetical protein LXG23DRAFT_48364 [Yarrowia lipolytica]QNP98055.1 Pore membrane protein of 33 kDa [Yarrowia lipolytica]|eukprot:XP_503197.2 YALI0D23617p [Yarrowia lipolytica CLIB122]